jgi:hypothetical protein
LAIVNNLFTLTVRLITAETKSSYNKSCKAAIVKFQIGLPKYFVSQVVCTDFEQKEEAISLKLEFVVVFLAFLQFECNHIHLLVAKIIPCVCCE